MRRAIRVALVVLGAAMHVCSAADEGDRNWSVAEATRAGDGRKVIYRYQERFGPGFQRAQFPDRVTIAWPYDTRTGLPSHSDLQAMDRLEESLRPYVETAAVSRLALVATGDNLREWVYYAASQREFMERANRALRNQPVLPIQFGLLKDARWQRYDELRKMLPADAGRGGSARRDEPEKKD